MSDRRQSGVQNPTRRRPGHRFPEHVTETNVSRNRPTSPPTTDSAQTNKVLTSRDLQPVKVDVIVGSESPSGWIFRIGPVKSSGSKVRTHPTTSCPQIPRQQTYLRHAASYCVRAAFHCRASSSSMRLCGQSAGAQKHSPPSQHARHRARQGTYLHCASWAPVGPCLETRTLHRAPLRTAFRSNTCAWLVTHGCVRSARVKQRGKPGPFPQHLHACVQILSAEQT